MVLQGRDAEVDVDADHIAALKLKWKTRDVEGELLKARLWLTRYPKRRPANVWRFVDNWLARAPATVKPPTVVNAWWASDERTINQGAAIGLAARPGETMAQYRDRIAAKLKEAA